MATATAVVAVADTVKPDLPDYEQRRVVNLYSESEVLRTFADYVGDCLLAIGYTEDHFYTNFRIGLTGLACVIGLYATAGTRFPEEKIKLIALLVVFAMVLIVLFVVETFFVQNAIMIVKGTNGKRMFMDGYLSKTNAQLILGVRQGTKYVSNSTYLGHCFDADGMLVTDTIFQELKKVLTEFDSAVELETAPPSTKQKSASKKLS